MYVVEHFSDHICMALRDIADTDKQLRCWSADPVTLTGPDELLTILIDDYDIAHNIEDAFDKISPCALDALRRLVDGAKEIDVGTFRNSDAREIVGDLRWAQVVSAARDLRQALNCPDFDDTFCVL
jgi:hypothetical protein